MSGIGTPLYAIARQGAEQKWREADELVELSYGHANIIDHDEVVEAQKCAQILDDFARQMYNDPAMWTDSISVTLTMRATEIESALGEGFVSPESADALTEELAEIYQYLAREQCDIPAGQLDDYAEARRLAARGESL